MLALNILFTLAFVAGICLVLYKMLLPLGLKIIDLCFESPRFHTGICFFLALMFCVGGGVQLMDFMEETSPGLARFFPLSFLIAGIFVYLGSLMHKRTE